MKSETETGMPPVKNEFAIQDVAAWVLRIGVISSVTVMLTGLFIVAAHGMPSVSMMKTFRFNDHIGSLIHDMMKGDGEAIIQIGILLLVLTPILRVAVSVILFAVVDRDWFYTAVTFVVLCLTLASLLFLR